jgi:hypothetical protein
LLDSYMSRFIRDAINLDIQKMLIFWDRRSIKLLLVTVAQLVPPLKNVVPSRNFLKGSPCCCVQISDIYIRNRSHVLIAPLATRLPPYSIQDTEEEDI